MSDDAEHEYDRDSISFVSRGRVPECQLDFNQKIFQVEFYFGADIAMTAVNANSEEEAIQAAIETIRRVGDRHPMTVEEILVTEFKGEEEDDGS